MSFTLLNILQNVMCPLQEIYRTCKNGMSSINHAAGRYTGNFTFCPVGIETRTGTETWTETRDQDRDRGTRTGTETENETGLGPRPGPRP